MITHDNAVKYVPFSRPKANAQDSLLAAPPCSLLPVHCSRKVMLVPPAISCSVIRQCRHFRGMPRQQHISKSVSNRRKALTHPVFRGKSPSAGRRIGLQTGQEAVKQGGIGTKGVKNAKGAIFKTQCSTLIPHPSTLIPFGSGQLVHQPFRRGWKCATRSTMRNLLAFNTLQQRTTYAPVTERSWGGAQVRLRPVVGGPHAAKKSRPTQSSNLGWIAIFW